MERWKGGKMERWKGGKVERWKGGKVERWKGGMWGFLIFTLQISNFFKKKILILLQTNIISLNILPHNHGITKNN